MNGLSADIDEAVGLAARLEMRSAPGRVALCPPATLIATMAHRLAGRGIELGGQDCHAKARGAHTGDISAEMLADAGATLVIVGHSERRADHGETDALVAAKALAARRAGLEPIICIGESEAQRESGEAVGVVVSQLRGSAPASLAGSGFFVAYEPVWAIGTGRTPAIAQIEEVHGAIRHELILLFGSDGAGIPILYGGSVKPANAREVLGAREVGGALVGGASLKAAEFAAIIDSF
jgi:triosephosphate isomerase